MSGMGARLVDAYGPEVPARVAAMLAAADPGFDAPRFVALALDGYAERGLTDRARLMAAALVATLPEPFPAAADLVERSLGPEIAGEEPTGMAAFAYLPHVYWVAEAGLGHPDRALALQHALTRRFTAEFSIRAYLDHHRELTLATLARWTSDPSAHVRRLVSEGTRPRLPWATRLRDFQRDPAPVLALLEPLRDDPSGYVRRSVANNLNDIGRDHPEVLLAVAARWSRDAGPDRRRLLRHALRTLTRAGDPAALALVGAGDPAAFVAAAPVVRPQEPAVGGAVRVTCTVTNTAAAAARGVVHLRVGFVTARGGIRSKTFLMGEAEIPPGASREFRTTVSLRVHTTRTPHPGRHALAVAVNGVVRAEGAFVLRGDVP